MKWSRCSSGPICDAPTCCPSWWGLTAPRRWRPPFGWPRSPRRPGPEYAGPLDFDIDDPKEPEVRDQLGRCADSLSAVGVRLAIEFLPYSCVATVSDAWELCDAVGWDAAGLLVDSWHTSVSGQVGSVHGLDADDIAMVQYSDGVLPTPRNVQDDSRNHRRVPGCGQFDLHGFVAAIVRTGYDGIISTEVLSADVRVAHPDIFAAELRRALRQHWESPPRAVPDWSVLGSARFRGLSSRDQREVTMANTGAVHTLPHGDGWANRREGASE